MQVTLRVSLFISGPVPELLQMREKKKSVAALKEELKEMKMSSAVDVRYQDKGSTAKNEHLSRLEQTQLEEMRKELVLVSGVGDDRKARA